MHLGEIGNEYSTPLASISLAFGSFFGGFILSKLSGQNGMLCGFIVSGILFMIITLISLFMGSENLGILTAIHALVMLLSGGIGGILGVNINKKIKI